MQKSILSIISLLTFSYLNLSAQLYYPPTDSEVWETTDPSTFNWDEDRINELYDFLEGSNTKAFILLKDGKIVLEQYFNEHDVNANWYWASAGKTLTAFMVGIAQQENLLAIEDSTSDYLGMGWTSCTPEQEAQITIRHQLTMTTGLDDQVDVGCTEPSCLQYKAAAGTRWSYHNAPYTLLTNVVENATNLNFNLYINQKLKGITGMNGGFLQQESNRVYFSTARSMARFGLLILNNGNWAATPILSDMDYLTDMLQPSQQINNSYGYLWWLNGQDSYMLPQSQIVFNGNLLLNAPADTKMALGKNGQFINVVPSRNMVWIRMGEAPDGSLVPYTLNDEIWGYINQLEGTSLAIDLEEDETEIPTEEKVMAVQPNPAKDEITIELPKSVQSAQVQLYIYNAVGNLIEIIQPASRQAVVALSNYQAGSYFVCMKSPTGQQILRFIKM